MESYRKLVKKLADESSSTLVPNGGTEHAEVLIENIFSHADNAVRIFTGELNKQVYGADDIVNYADYFLRKSSANKLMILIQNYDDELKFTDHELIKMCEEHVQSGACEIKAVSDVDKDVTSHFVIMDEIGYRFEPDRKKPTAVGCFNDVDGAKDLIDGFDRMFDRADKIELELEH